MRGTIEAAGEAEVAGLPIRRGPGRRSADWLVAHNRFWYACLCGMVGVFAGSGLGI